MDAADLGNTRFVFGPVIDPLCRADIDVILRLLFAGKEPLCRALQLSVTAQLPVQAGGDNDLTILRPFALFDTQ